MACACLCPAGAGGSRLIAALGRTNRLYRTMAVWRPVQLWVLLGSYAGHRGSGILQLSVSAGSEV